ncbi:hypothetical protein [Methylophilus luteus]|jgi:hypothetical protein|uniref:Uncharacterized protein n=1 Tax=Methylophilus luteus TaxID=640108 RepID=A0ABW3F9L5_9PROT
MIEILENAENQMYRGGQDLAGTEDGFDVRAAGIMDGIFDTYQKGAPPIATIKSDSGGS